MRLFCQGRLYAAFLFFPLSFGYYFCIRGIWSGPAQTICTLNVFNITVIKTVITFPNNKLQCTALMTVMCHIWPLLLSTLCQDGNVICWNIEDEAQS